MKLHKRRGHAGLARFLRSVRALMHRNGRRWAVTRALSCAWCALSNRGTHAPTAEAWWDKGGIRSSMQQRALGQGGREVDGCVGGVAQQEARAGAPAAAARLQVGRLQLEAERVERAPCTRGHGIRQHGLWHHTLAPSFRS